MKVGSCANTTGRRRSQRIALMVLALVEFGCMVGPNYKPPNLELPARYEAGSKPAPQSAQSDLAQWWRGFDDPVLDRLVAQALSSNLDLMDAVARVREARALQNEASAALYPSLSNGWSYSRIRYSETTPFGSFPQIFPVEYNLFEGGFNSSWDLDLFGGIRRGIQAQQAELERAAENERDVRVAVLAEIGQDYVNVRSLQRRIAIAQSNTAAQRASLELTQERFQMGFAAELDVAQARSLMLATQTTIPTLKTQLVQTIHQLGVLLGRPPEALSSSLSATRPLLPVSQLDVLKQRIPPGLPSELLRRRPDIRAAEREMAAASARVGVATAAFFPDFSLTGTVGLESIALSNFIEGASRFWTVGPTLTLPIFEGGRLKAQLAAANAEQDQALLIYKKTVLQALEEVEDALSASAQERARHLLLAQNVAAAQRTTDLAEDRYTHGIGSYLDVLEAQRSLYQAQDQLAQSHQLMALDLIALFKALGGGWSPAQG